MTRIAWWMVESLSRLLDDDEREVVRGDLAECGTRAGHALREVAGLVLRRQIALWFGWKPWLALLTVVVPIGVLLSHASRLWADAGMVVALRSWRMMSGGPVAAQREVDRMLSEKVEAGFELAGALAGGRLKTPEAAARTALGVYGKRVRGNRKRLG